jgi:hypothetical protein
MVHSENERGAGSVPLNRPAGARGYATASRAADGRSGDGVCGQVDTDDVVLPGRIVQRPHVGADRTAVERPLFLAATVPLSE